MKVFDLQCAQGHVFEGWFASEDDFKKQCAQEFVVCPFCGDTHITRRPSAPRLNAKSNTRNAQVKFSDERVAAKRGEVSPAGAAGVPVTKASHLPHEAMQRLWQQVVDHVVKNTEDVGERFAEEARRIHYGEVPEHGIRGQTTPQEAQELQDEGIEVMALPLPIVPKEKLQ